MAIRREAKTYYKCDRCGMEIERLQDPPNARPNTLGWTDLSLSPRDGGVPLTALLCPSCDNNLRECFHARASTTPFAPLSKDDQRLLDELKRGSVAGRSESGHYWLGLIGKTTAERVTASTTRLLAAGFIRDDSGRIVLTDLGRAVP